MRTHANQPGIIQRHLDRLEKSVGDLESVCSNCGDCCCASINIGKSIIVVPELPCRFLVIKSSGKFNCSVYEERFAKAPWCQDLLSGALTGAYPVSCNYMKGLSGYNGGIKLTENDYELVRPELQKIIKANQSSELQKAFHKEDVQSFIGDDPWLSKGMSAFADVDPSAWLTSEFPQLAPRVHEFLSQSFII